MRGNKWLGPALLSNSLGCVPMVTVLLLGSSSPEKSGSGSEIGPRRNLGRWGKEFGEMVRNSSGGNWFNGICST